MQPNFRSHLKAAPFLLRPAGHGRMIYVVYPGTDRVIGRIYPIRIGAMLLRWGVSAVPPADSPIRSIMVMNSQTGTIQFDSIGACRQALFRSQGWRAEAQEGGSPLDRNERGVRRR